MQIKKIKVSNFKSFDEVEIELGRFNVLIGANASGKSNFINILQFLKDIAEYGLDNAISMQGGVDYIRNINIGASKNLSIELHIDSKDKPVKSFGFGKEEDERLILISAHEFRYKFSIEFNKRGRGYNVADERLVANCDFVEAELEKKERKISEKEKIGFLEKRDPRPYHFVGREKELKILQKYLPEQMSEEEVRKIIQETIKESEVSDFGKAMGMAMGKLKGKADGNLVGRIVKEERGK